METERRWYINRASRRSRKETAVLLKMIFSETLAHTHSELFVSAIPCNIRNWCWVSRWLSAKLVTFWNRISREKPIISSARVVASFGIVLSTSPSTLVSFVFRFVKETLKIPWTDNRDHYRHTRSVFSSVCVLEAFKRIKIELHLSGQEEKKSRMIKFLSREWKPKKFLNCEIVRRNPESVTLECKYLLPVEKKLKAAKQLQLQAFNKIG